jgi:hypothetical protein
VRLPLFFRCIDGRGIPCSSDPKRLADLACGYSTEAPVGPVLPVPDGAAPVGSPELEGAQFNEHARRNPHRWL